MQQATVTHNPESKFMSALTAIYARRAVRNYTKRKVAPSLVTELVNAAIHAPSAMNSQPWAFVVIQKPELLKEISDKAKEFLAQSPHWKERSEHAKGPFNDPNFDIFYGATTLIVICARKSDHAAFSPAEDCYLAGENLMLAACAMGLGTCPIGFARDVLRTENFEKRLAIPSEYVPVLPIIVGYPSGRSGEVEREPAKIFSWVQ